MVKVDNQSFEKYYRAANYLSAVQIFLKDNFLLDRPLNFNDIKPRLLGHWGSCPGVNMAYLHVSHFVKKHNQEVLFMLGSGHAYPALQANLFMEDTLREFYPEARQTYNGIGYLCKEFGWPYGFSSYVNAMTPGAILEGGELGYSLATAYGAVLDNPDLMVACLISDGEAETGPLAASWHLNKIIDFTSNGVVLPILHLNGYKMSGPTIFGRMKNDELIDLFRGYGYIPVIVDSYQTEKNIHEQMEEALDWCYEKIKEVKLVNDKRLPMIIMRTKKGDSGIKQFDGRKIEDNCLSHHVVLPNAKEDPKQLEALENWLRSYRFNELFDRQDGFGDFVSDVLPVSYKRMGMSQRFNSGDPFYKALKLPEVELFAEDASMPGQAGSSSMRRAGLYLSEVFKLNKNNHNFIFLSPDETYFDKLDEIFSEEKRSFTSEIQPWDEDMSNQNGRIFELMSEHALQGLMEGYVLSGRHAVFNCYEAFVQIISSMIDQYMKLLLQMKNVPWRHPISSLNYILTSSGWKQEHNGFSNQDPGFIDSMLKEPGNISNIYFPPDGNSMLAVLEKCLNSNNKVNVIIAGKTLQPRWLTTYEASNELRTGISEWKFASDDNPQIVVAAAGDYVTNEALAAIDIVKKTKSDVRIRFVNIMHLDSNGICTSSEDFNGIFTDDKPIIFSFYGHSETLKSLLFNYLNNFSRCIIHGYTDNGSSTTPFDMHVHNGTSRYDLATDIIKKLSESGSIPKEESSRIISEYKKVLDKNLAYLKINGVDMPEISEWHWNH